MPSPGSYMQNDFKLSAVVITFYPPKDELIHNIKQFINHVDTLIIWENTPDGIRESYHPALPEYNNKIIYLGTNKNEGIAYPLNRSIEWSIKNKFTHILAMDQDSCWDNFGYYKSKISEYNNIPDIGIFAPVIYEKSKRNLQDLSYVKDVITSGAVYKLKMVEEIGLFREDFFIDAVDLEYCYWAARNSYKTAVLGGAFLKQQYGKSTEHKFLNKTYRPLNYSAFRIFHIVRNHIFLWKEFPELSDFEKSRIIQVYILRRMKEIVLFEKDKINKLFSVFKGIFFGLLSIGEVRRRKVTS